MTLLALFFPLSAFAAPIPVTSSSQYIQPELGMFRSPHGFSIHAGKTTWLHHAPSRSNPYIATIYRAPKVENGVQAALTVRLDKLEKKISLKRYAKKWLRDYPRFGIDVLSNKKVKVGEYSAYLIDMIDRDSAKQLRQVLFLKNNRVAILTCRDHKKTFRRSLKACNKIIRNFEWNKKS